MQARLSSSPSPVVTEDEWVGRSCSYSGLLAHMICRDFHTRAAQGRCGAVR